jgi:hypothetical protein
MAQKKQVAIWVCLLVGATGLSSLSVFYYRTTQGAERDRDLTNPDAVTFGPINTDRHASPQRANNERSVQSRPADKDAYEKIHLGMTIDTLRAQFGAWGTDMAAYAVTEGRERGIAEMHYEGTWDSRPDDNEPGKRWLWSGPDVTICVRINSDQHVTDKMYIRLTPLHP